MGAIKYTLLGFFSLMTLSAFSNDEQSNSDNLTISIYSGVGYENLGGTKGVGTELMYKNVSLSLGYGKGYSPNMDESDRYGYNYHPDINIGRSIGIKVYNSSGNAKNKVFIGFNHISSYPYELDKDERKVQNDNTIIAGYRHTTSSGIYLSSYICPYSYARTNYSVDYGRITNYFPDIKPTFGLNVGYQFRPINLK